MHFLICVSFIFTKEDNYDKSYSRVVTCKSLVIAEGHAYLFEGSFQCHFHIFWESLILEQADMKVISHVIGFGYSFIAVVDSEERDHFLFGGGFGEVGDDADSIFVVGEHGSWMTVG